MTEHHSSLYFVLFGLGFIRLFLSRTPCWNIMKSEWFADNADNYCWRNTYFRYRSSVMKVGFPSCRLLNALSEYLFTSTSLSQLTQNQMLPKYTEVHIQDWFMESRLHVIIVLSNFRFWLLIFFLNHILNQSINHYKKTGQIFINWTQKSHNVYQNLDEVLGSWWWGVFRVGWR